MKPSARQPVIPQQPLTRQARGRQALWIAAILLLALTLRLWNLGAKSLWLDEVMTVHKATSSFSAMMDEVKRTDAHPPLFQIVEWLWLRLGRGDAFARLPSVAMGVAVVWLTFLVARRLAGRKAAIASGVVMALSYFQIFYSQEARLHTMATALFLAQAYLLLQIVACRGCAGWGLWLLYALAGLASLYTYALCILTIGALALLYALLSWQRRPQWGRWFLSHLLIGAAFFPWYWSVLRVTTAALAKSIRDNGDAVAGPTASQVIGGIASWGVGPTDWSPLPVVGTLIGLALIAGAVVALHSRRSRKPALVLGVLFFAPLIGYLLLPVPRVHFYEAKHLILLQPLLVIAVCAARRRTVVERAVPSALSHDERTAHAERSLTSAAGTPRTTSASSSTVRTSRATTNTFRVPLAAYVAAALIAFNLYNLSDYFSRSFQKEDWRGLTDEVQRRLRPGDLVLFNPGYAGFAFIHYQTQARDIPQSTCENLLAGNVPTSEFRRVWLATCYSPVSRPYATAPAALAREGWNPQEEYRYPSNAWNGGLHWALFERGNNPNETATTDERR